MAGGDSYKEFDTASVIPSEDSVVLLGKYKFRKRDLLFGGITALALLTCLILAIALGVVANQRHDGAASVAASNALTGDNCSETAGTSSPQVTPAPSTDKRTQTTTSKQEQPTTGRPAQPCTTLPPKPVQPCTSTLPAEFCETAPCLQASTYALTNMNESVDPCEDFYSFACGKFHEASPPVMYTSDITPKNIIHDQNAIRLLRSLLESVEEGHELSYERKLKQFLQSCTDHFNKLGRRGLPFVESIVKPLGGWYLLDTWSVSDFNLQTILTKANIDFMANIFFRVSVTYTSHNWNQPIIELHESSSRYTWLYYLGKLNEYIGGLCSLIQRDSNPPVNNTIRLNQVIDDVVEVGLRLDMIATYIPESEAHLPEKLYTLSQLNNNVSNKFDFVDFMNKLLNDSGRTFTADTKIAVIHPAYFSELGSFLSDFLSNEQNKRKLHNYILFTILEVYHKELSWEYVKVLEQVMSFGDDDESTSSPNSNCMTVLQLYMQDALNALFVKKFVDVRNKNEGDAISTKIVDQMKESLDKATWLTPEDKQASKTKIENSLYKIGFSNLLLNTTYIESIYGKVNITSNRYFENVISLHAITRKSMSDQLKFPGDRSLWFYSVYFPVVEYYNPWSELMATAAVLQSPLFDHKGPVYYNFGSLGTMLASELVNAINEYGNQYKLDGSHYGSWWSNETTQRYNQIKDCADEAQRNEILGPFNLGNISPTVNISRYSKYYATILLSRAAGLRLSYLAYKKYESLVGKEKMPAGIHRYTADQMFFVAHAQANCEDKPDLLKYIHLLRGQYPSKNSVNLELSQLPEFRRAFNCQLGQRMFVEKTCSLL
ncbi:endothelin-converting enzyme 2-like [Biomphalaria glabrata]|uniref:Endothelin-converting enzyme 2-like n=1 Tax=Biomphalaria glabrata TaxID=6526 RepID=A0A9W3BL52_BIOGL|nr:endothelin-converting enzyme 2-like [Biomphalaria glabrata]XP_055900250.1 endothelin-converting enzyme 2-like [Biomphalaria glabrata]XP_055900251.1 endothelin-converting enzyme 2-like [Biomphalaria glabrata]